MSRVAVYGWGLVAPGAKNLKEFEHRTATARCGLAPDRRLELGAGLFAVGDPSFDIEDYRAWISARHGEAYFSRLQAKMSDNALFALGSTIQALESNPGLEAAIREADVKAQVLIGSGVGDIPRTQAAYQEFQKARRAWFRFWAHPSRCPALRHYVDYGVAPEGAPVPPDPQQLEPDSEQRFEGLVRWHEFWAGHSPPRREFELRYAEVERIPIGDKVETGGPRAIQERQRRHRRLLEETGCPQPPWSAVNPNLLWAIQNVPAAQVSMLLGIHGPAFAPVAACSTFGVGLKLGYDAVRTGAAKVAIVGSTDPRPEPTLISAFHRARLAPAGADVCAPFTSLRGTHVSGGACTWIIADCDHMSRRGLQPVGPVIEAIELSSDAEHIITPSREGPKAAIRAAFEACGAGRADIGVWDMHATGTPGDVTELALTREFVGEQTVLTARKGLYGHGMSNAAGWELTALAVDMLNGRTSPVGVEARDIHPTLRQDFASKIATDERPLRAPFGVKMMLGIGGITVCVMLRRPGDRLDRPAVEDASSGRR
jgi:3-oxoacyl-[acyl-carrier-protein] synthase II